MSLSVIGFFSATSAMVLTFGLTVNAGSIAIQNGSFESPTVPAAAPYASPEMDSWQKSTQPAWYDPSQNADTPWSYLMGEFYNVPFPGQFIDNCDGTQAAFLFAVPEAALFQDYDTVGGTNTVPTHAFNATFNVGKSYDLSVGVIGGGGGMKPGASLQISLYYRNALSNKVVVASTNVINSTKLFPTSTHFIDFQVHVPVVQQADPWAGQHIGVQLLSTTGFESIGGYWDLDNVRLHESGLLLSNPALKNNQFTFSVQSDLGAKVEVLATTNVTAALNNWTSLGVYTNSAGTLTITEDASGQPHRYYRARQL